MSNVLDDLEALEQTERKLTDDALKLLIRSYAEGPSLALDARLEATSKAVQQVKRAIVMLRRDVA